MDKGLQHDVLNRLDQDGAIKDKVASLILAALLGDIEGCLAGKTPSRPSTVQQQVQSLSERMWNRSPWKDFEASAPGQSCLFMPARGLRWSSAERLREIQLL